MANPLVEVAMLEHLNLLVQPGLVVEFGYGEIVALPSDEAAVWCKSGWARLLCGAVPCGVEGGVARAE